LRDFFPAATGARLAVSTLATVNPLT
jgi:hypothetical protein